MTSPSPSWNTVPVFGTYRKIDGTPHTGLIRFTFATRVTANTDDIIFPAGGVLDVALDETGHFSLDCPAVDDPDNTPDDWSIKVEEKLDAGGGLIYYIQPKLNMLPVGLDLRQVNIPANASPASPVVRGVPGGIAALDEDGNVVDAFGNKLSVTIADGLLKASNLHDLPSPDAALANLHTAKWVTPEQFNLGSDAANWQACLNVGASSTDHTVIVARYGKTYNLGTTTLAWDSAHGSITVQAFGSTLSSTSTGSVITALTHTGGNTPPRMKWFGGTYSSSTCSKFFDCTDVRSSLWQHNTFAVPAGIAISMLNVNSFCERNSFLDINDFACQQVLVLERGFKTTTSACTFNTGNTITQVAHGFQSGDWCRFSTVGTSGLTVGRTYFVGSVIDANTYTIFPAECDAFGNYAGTAITFASTSAGTATDLASSSFARTRVERLHLTGGVYGYAKIEINNCGPYDSQFGPIVGNISNGVVVIDFLNGRSIGNTTFGPIMVEASDDGHKITGSAATNVITVDSAPSSRPLAVGQPVQLAKTVGGSGVVAEQVYYIKTLPTATTFTISATPGGATVALGTDITAGFFWNVRPAKYRWGQSAGAPPVLNEPTTLRNLAMFDPVQFNADGLTPSVPDGTLKVWQSVNLPGAVIQNAKQYTGVDIRENQTSMPSPNNPTIFGSGGGSLDQAGSLYLMPAHGKGIFVVDGSGNVVLGVDHAGVLSGTLLSSLAAAPGTPLASVYFHPAAAQTDATLTSASMTDLSAACITAGWTGASAGMFDLTFTAPANGIVLFEIEAFLKTSTAGAQVRFQLVNTGTGTALSNSDFGLTAITTQARLAYHYKATGLTPGATYTIRPQWRTGAATTGTISAGSNNGPVRINAIAWK